MGPPTDAFGIQSLWPPSASPSMNDEVRAPAKGPSSAPSIPSSSDKVVTTLEAILEAISKLNSKPGASENSCGETVQPSCMKPHQNGPFKSKTFGLHKEQSERVNPIAAEYDYRLKYPPDERYKELDEEARVWKVYLDEANDFDNDMVGEFNDSLDILLVFAGLFSAVLTTFVAQTSQTLPVDNNQLTVSYLAELTLLVRAGGNETAISRVPMTRTPLSPALGDLWVNGLWFTSLAISLSVALFAVLAKQWLRQYMSIITGMPRERAFIRQFRFDGLKKWRVQAIISFLPVLLHIALVLFLVGLVIFLIPLSLPIAYVTGTLTSLVVFLYLAASTLPIFIVNCAYRTTFTDSLYYAYQLPLTLFLKLKTKIILSDDESERSLLPIRSLKEVERNKACRQSKGAQDLELKALYWLADLTSIASAKEIIHRSLGAFTSTMTLKLANRKALRTLYGAKVSELSNVAAAYVPVQVEYVSNLLVGFWQRNNDLEYLENVSRAAVHHVELIHGGLGPQWQFFQLDLSELEITTPSGLQVVLTVVALGFNVSFRYENSSTSLNSRNALSWIWARRSEFLDLPLLPALVWKALIKWSEVNKMPVLEEIRQYVRSYYKFNSGESARPISLNRVVRYERLGWYPERLSESVGTGSSQVVRPT